MLAYVSFICDIHCSLWILYFIYLYTCVPTFNLNFPNLLQIKNTQNAFEADIYYQYFRELKICSHKTSLCDASILPQDGSADGASTK